MAQGWGFSLHRGHSARPVVVIAMTGAILLRLLGRLVVGKRVFLAGGVVMGR
jgi:hypothetical protein